MEKETPGVVEFDPKKFEKELEHVRGYLDKMGFKSVDLNSSWKHSKVKAFSSNPNYPETDNDLNLLKSECFVTEIEDPSIEGYKVILNIDSSGQGDVLVRMLNSRSIASSGSGKDAINFVEIKRKKIKTGETETVSVRLIQRDIADTSGTSGVYSWSSGEPVGSYVADFGKKGSNFMLDMHGDPNYRKEDLDAQRKFIQDRITGSISQADMQKGLDSLKPTALPGIQESLYLRVLKSNGSRPEFVKKAIEKMMNLQNTPLY